MNMFQKKMWLLGCTILLSLPLHGMLTNVCRSYSNGASIAHKRLFGIQATSLPQTATGVLGDFGSLDQRYGIRRILAPYIAKNQDITEEEACFEHWRETSRAYRQFLDHNSTTNILHALRSKRITVEYAKRALLFSEHVAWEFQQYLEHNQMLSRDYKASPEKGRYRDCTYLSKECLNLLTDIKRERNGVRSELDRISKQLGEDKKE